MSDSYVPSAAHYDLSAPLTAFTVSILLVWWLATGRLSKAILDYPKARSLHETPVPRTGGLGLHAGPLAALGILNLNFPAALWVAFAAISLISFLDDVRGIAPTLRLAVHLSACGLFAHEALGQDGTVAVLIATLICTWMANLYNFMDGSDGLAGGMAVVGFSCFGIAAMIAGHSPFALFNFSIAASAAAFLFFNFHPARIFLGDVGSVPLGFLAASLGIVGWLQDLWMWWFPLLVFGPFVIDATVTLARRIFKLEKVWRAHRDHYYQRLVRMGWGHRKTALLEYSVMITGGIAGLFALQMPDGAQVTILIATALAYTALLGSIEIRWRRHLAVNRP